MTMRDMDEACGRGGGARAAAWAVHGYTALGALAAFAAVLAVFDGAYRTAFLWLVAATVVDATDGTLARLARVAERTPGFDGARLDDIVDYLTYVFVPVLLLYHAGTLPEGVGLPVAGIVLLSSAYGFASLDAKTDDGFFTGFPSYWNVVAVYLVAAGLPAVVNAMMLIVLSALVFVRIGYVYPTRTPVARGVTLVLGGVWAVAMVAIIAMMPDVPGGLVAGSLLFPVYYVLLSLHLHRRRGRRA
jgi:phosphatidylcholine synthase